MDIYVGNLSFDATRDDLVELFEKFGKVAEVRIIMEKRGVKSKRYAFIEMPSEDKARRAIEETNGIEFKERALSVNEAKPKTSRTRRAKSAPRKKRRRKRRSVYGGEDRNESSVIRRRRRGRGKWY